MKNYPPLIDPDFKEFLDNMKNDVIASTLFKYDEKFRQELIDFSYSDRRAGMDDNKYLADIINIARKNCYETAVILSFDLLAFYHHWLMGKLEQTHQTTDQGSE